MPRHDKSATPPEKRRAPKGSVVERQTLRHTAESLALRLQLQDAWGLSADETIREALRRCATAE